MGQDQVPDKIGVGLASSRLAQRPVDQQQRRQLVPERDAAVEPAAGRPAPTWPTAGRRRSRPSAPPAPARTARPARSCAPCRRRAGTRRVTTACAAPSGRPGQCRQQRRGLVPGLLAVLLQATPSRCCATLAESARIRVFGARPPVRDRIQRRAVRHGSRARRVESGHGVIAAVGRSSPAAPRQAAPAPRR